MEIKEMNLEQLEARMAEIRSMNIDELSQEQVGAISTEVDAIEARMAEMRADATARNEIRNKIANGTMPAKPLEGENRNMENVITRNSEEYQRAFLKAFRTNDLRECRSLLSTNANNGTIEVPEVLVTEIKNAWENHTMISNANVTSQKGNVVCPFEYAASAAAGHTEGAAAADEGTISIGYVTIKAENIMKWITVSVEAIEDSTINTLQEIYRSLANKIVEGVESKAVGVIDALPATSDATHPCVGKLNVATITESTISDVTSLLSAQAKNVHLIMNRRTRAAFKAVQKSAKYNVDVFDGLDDKIIFTDALPAFQDITAASEGQTPKTYLIAGDLSLLRVNRPNGEEIKTVLDEITLANQGMDKVTGRSFVGVGVEAPKAFAKLVK